MSLLKACQYYIYMKIKLNIIIMVKCMGPIGLQVENDDWKGFECYMSDSQATSQIQYELQKSV